MAKSAKQNNNVVIVESPAKAKTIERYLGKGYKVAASMGHVRDLPPKRLGVDVENDFEPEYEVLGSKKKVVAGLKKAVRGAGDVYMATDLDREGEAIAWHLCQALGLDPDAEDLHRVTFNEITKSAIREAFAHPGRINMDKVSAQEARRILDRLVGYKLSPLLWKKVAKGLSAGRVQSVATRLVVEKEQELRAFRPEESWRVTAELARAGDAETTFKAHLAEVNGETFAAGNRDEAEAVGAWLRDAAYTVRSAERKRTKDRPSPPFITSELQRAASSRLGFSTRKTMTVAQHLYQGVELGEEGSVALITYMRTDSHRVAPSAREAARDLIQRTYGEQYLPEKPTHYRSKKGAQEAHEAIRPTDVSRTPDSVAKHLRRDDARLYDLIWTQFVASQMAPALWDVTDVQVQAAETSQNAEAAAEGRNGLFKARGRVLVFDGYTKVAGVRQRKDEQQLPDVVQGDPLDLQALDLSQHFSRPPARYTEASLVRRLEELGIGRPSTYATIISTIQDRGYVEQKRNMFLRCTGYPQCRYTVPCDLRGRPIGPKVEHEQCNACGKKMEAKHGKRSLYATDLGEVVTEKLLAHFPRVMDYAFTSHVEDELDDVEASRLDWLRVVRRFWEPFSEALQQARDEMESAKHQVAEDAGPCPDCGAQLVKRWSKNGPFLGCENFPDCKYTRPLEADQRPEPKPTDHTCETCGGRMLLRTNRRGEPFLGCENYPKCRHTLPCDADGNPVRPIETNETCEKCGAAMVVRRGRRGPFLACSAFPKCRNTRPLTDDLKKQLGIATKGKGKGTAGSGGKGGKGGSAAKRQGGRRSRPKAIPTDRTCPDCGEGLVIRSGRRGRFLGCSAYPKCRHTENLPDDLEETAEAEGG